MKPSATVAVNAKALELRRQGVDLVFYASFKCKGYKHT